MKKEYISKYGLNCLLLATVLFFAGCATSRKAERIAKANQEAKEKAIKEKYADKIGIPADSVNLPLYSFVDEWYGTPYKYAGHTKSGVDCSDFVCILLQEIYNKTLTGSAITMYDSCTVVSTDSLKQGDLLFFKINHSKSISHVAFYLQNNKFVHATVHAGVMIDDLSEEYYKKYFYKAGRLKA